MGVATMKYRIQADLILDNEDEAKRIFQLLKRNLKLYKAIRRGEPFEERSRLSIHKCYHDEETPKPCEIIEEIIVEEAER